MSDKKPKAVLICGDYHASQDIAKALSTLDVELIHSIPNHECKNTGDIVDEIMSLRYGSIGIPEYPESLLVDRKSRRSGQKQNKWKYK